MPGGSPSSATTGKVKATVNKKIVVSRIDRKLVDFWFTFFPLLNEPLASRQAA
jgi:hypothetical protein